MAEEKKDKKPEGWNLNTVEVLFLLIFLVAISGALVSLFRFTLGSGGAGGLSFFGIKLSTIWGALKGLVGFLKYLGVALAGFGAVATIVFNKRSSAIWAAEKAKLYPAEMPMGVAEGPFLDPVMSKWQEIVAKSESLDENNWRIAIIEADIILDSLLEKLNLPGATTGEKLKAVEPSDFLTLDNAWEAHKARNNIAHQGSNFLLNQREVRRIISLYESVFKEFHLI